MEKLLQDMDANMMLAGFSSSTRKSYLMGVRHLQEFYQCRADLLNEDQIKKFLLHLKQDKQLASNTLKQRYYAVQFLFVKMLGRELQVFKFLKSKVEQKLPVILSQDEVIRLIKAIRKTQYKMIAKITYCCGLRINETLNLHANNINRERMMIEIRNSKGLKDRYIPMPVELLKELEVYWSSHRRKAPGLYLFPKAATQYGEAPGLPVGPSGFRRALKKACQDAAINKRVTPHTLRHCYATHLLEDGVSIRALQALLGHKNLASTSIYTHVTQNSEKKVLQKINGLFDALE